MKKLISSFFILSLTMTSLSNNAADVEAGIVKSPQNNFNKPQLLLNDNFTPSDLEIEVIEKSDLIQNDAGPVTLAPARGIEYFEIIRVGSSQVGWEDGVENRFSTLNDHGGAELLVGVLQIGYGNPNQATMNGISRSPLIEFRLCGADLHECRVGETIIGWLYYYDFSGQQSGNFNISASSTASPFGFWSDSVFIR